MFNNIYKNKKVFITGNTGFKGSWLATWLTMLGATVKGYSHSIYPHFSLLGNEIDTDFYDIRNYELLYTSLNDFQPEIVYHLSAQPLVKESYTDPKYTFDVNAIGTSNVLDACRNIESLRAICIVTTDKVYADINNSYGYKEEDELGGYDPYSSSKVCAEIITDSYRKSFFKSINKNVLIATARAGNCIFGGDWGKDRIIPDLIRAYKNKESLLIRNPESVRPWSSVLDVLYGYLLLGQNLLEGKSNYDSAWNFGTEKSMTVRDLLDFSMKYWNDLKSVPIIWNKPDFHETKLLLLNSNKANTNLNWSPILSINETIAWTMGWYRAYYQEGKIITTQQIEKYMEMLGK